MLYFVIYWYMECAESITGDSLLGPISVSNSMRWCVQIKTETWVIGLGGRILEKRNPPHKVANKQGRKVREGQGGTKKMPKIMLYRE